jgi:hypothetical protein
MAGAIYYSVLVVISKHGQYIEKVMSVEACSLSPYFVVIFAISL